MNKLWEKIKKWFKDLWEKIKKWFVETAWDWIKKGWLQVINVIIVLVAYGKLKDLDSKTYVLVGFWAFILIGYWLFWKFLGGDKMIKKWIKQIIEKRRKK